MELNVVTAHARYSGRHRAPPAAYTPNIHGRKPHWPPTGEEDDTRHEGASVLGGDDMLSEVGRGNCRLACFDSHAVDARHTANNLAR